jgi:DNA-binding Xre family transcriptional regulator
MLNARKIRQLRMKLGMSLADAAKAAGWKPSGRHRWHDFETGRRTSVTITTLEAIANALACEPADLLEKKAPKKILEKM